MSGALFALIAAVLSGIGSRDQMMVAGLARSNGQHHALLGVAMASAVASSVVAALAASAVLPMLASDARRLLAGIALALAAGELMLIKPKAPAREPTHSLGATAIVLFAQQLTDATRFIIFALAVGAGSSFAAAAGGAAGSAAVVAAGWLGSDELAGRNLRGWRIGAGALLLAGAAVFAWMVLRR